MIEIAVPSTLAEKDKAIAAALADLTKEHGAGIMQRMGDRVAEPIPSIPTGVYSVDYHVIGTGGVPRGRITEVLGPECISGDSFVRFAVWENGVRVNHKGGTIRRLHERFHNLEPTGDGRGKSCHRTLDHPVFTAPSVNEAGRIVHKRVLNVVAAGMKDCFKVVTKYGLEIVASGDHEFMTPSGFQKLSALGAGRTVFVHRSVHFKKDEVAERINRSEIFVKNHPIAGKKVVDGKYEYHRIYRSRAVVEAALNDMDLETYINRLNSGEDLWDLVFLPSDQHVHHDNEDATDDRLENLVVTDASEHGAHHATERHNNLRFMVVSDLIVSVEPVGQVETYDLCMEAPYHNYVADGFVVHNSSGKTTTALQVVASAQRAGGRAGYIDVEHALDPSWAAILGVNMDDLVVSQPDYGEQALQVLERCLESMAFDVLVVDSVAALVPKAELDGDIGDSHMGLHARLMSQAMRKLAGLIRRSNCAVIFINQIREKIGVTFGSPETTTGGRALKFYASLRLDIRRIGQIKSGDEIIGNKTKIKCVKNKVAAPFREAEVELIYGRGFDRESNLITAAAERGAVEKSGSWYSFDGERIGQGIANAAEFVREHGLYDKLLKAVREKDV